MSGARPFVLCLTGSLGMGKSTAAKFFAEAGVPVHDSDAVVHALYEGEAVAAIEAAFPGTTAGGKVDRGKLAAMVIDDKAALARLEAIVHPLVARARDKFLADAQARGATVVVLDIPLLFEIGGEAAAMPSSWSRRRPRCNAAAPWTRPGMTEEKFASLIGQADAGRGKARAARILSWIARRASITPAPRCTTF